jgi:glutaredoxin
MEYLLFTYPNCPKCDALKEYLEEIDLQCDECSLVVRESKLKIQEFLKDIKRDDKGGIIIPVLVVKEEGEVAAVLNSREELEAWLRSRA